MGAALFVLVLVAAGFVIRTVLGEAHRRDRLDAAEERASDLADARIQAALARPGSTPQDPEEVESAAVIEPRARAEGCPYCEGQVHVEEHGTVLAGAQRVRKVVLKCGACGRRSERFYRVAPVLTN